MGFFKEGLGGGGAFTISAQTQGSRNSKVSFSAESVVVILYVFRYFVVLTAAVPKSESTFSLIIVYSLINFSMNHNSTLLFFLPLNQIH